MKAMMKELNSIEELENIKDNGVNVLVFSADWCPDCMFIKPFMPKLIDKYKNYNFIYIDTTKFPEIVQEYEIMGIPSFILLKEGKEVDRFVSKLRKTESQIDAFLGGLK